MSVAITEGIRVEVEPAYWAENSDPRQGRWAFTYTIRVTNLGQRPARLLRRHWIIRDGAGAVEEVEGEGVVGRQPSLDPGESFEYTSWVPLPTPIGTMHGSFLFVRPDGSRFRAQVAEFVLAQPDALH